MLRRWHILLKILIVDDEFYFREALKISLPWEKLGFSICGEAKNGKDALEKISILNPDIVLVDINMPIMDGLEFVQCVNEMKLNIKIVILTGYSEFNYAKQAVQLGVNNYLLKPVNEEEMAKTLKQLKKIIESEKDRKIQFDMLKKQVQESLPVLKDKQLNELLLRSSALNMQRIEEKFKYLNINILSEYYQVAVIELDNESDFNWNEEDKQLWRFAVSNIVREIFSEIFNLEVFNDNSEKICVILGYVDNYKDKCSLDLDVMFGQLKDIVEKYFTFTITIGVGNVKINLSDISSSYKEAVFALKNNIVFGNNNVIMYSGITDSSLTKNIDTIEYKNQLLMDMRMANTSGVTKILNKMFKEIKERSINHEFLFVICIEVISICFEFIAESGYNLIDILHDNQLNIITKVQTMKNLALLEQYINNIFIDVIKSIEKNKISKARKLIEEIREYINDNYHNEELNIAEISNHFYINYSYLCYLFKREVGNTINEYIIEVRLKKAKVLFDGGNKLVSDVAERVGYSDANYFGKCFKKRYGVSPSKYIENI